MAINIIGIGGMGANALNGIRVERPDFLSGVEIHCFKTYEAERSLFRKPDSPKEWGVADVASMLKGRDTVLIAGLGGKNGSPGMVALINNLEERTHKVACFVSLPFGFEGTARKEAAQHDLAVLLAGDSLVVTFNNQELFDVMDEKATFSDAFRLVDSEMQRAITEYLAAGSLFGKSKGLVEWSFTAEPARAA